MVQQPVRCQEKPKGEAMMRNSSGNLCEFAPSGHVLLRRICLLALAASLFACFTGRLANAQSAPANDEEYGKKIHEFRRSHFS
jgi:hypothetical protein